MAMVGVLVDIVECFYNVSCRFHTRKKKGGVYVRKNILLVGVLCVNMSEKFYLMKNLRTEGY